MLTRLPIFASLATLAVADYRIYWITPDNSVLGRLQTNVKMFTSQPDCASLPGGKQLNFNIQRDVSDSTGGGYVCDGCDPSQEPAQWIPTRIELNDRDHKVFNGQPFHITLNRNNDGSYAVTDTQNRNHGSCVLGGKDRQVLKCNKDKNIALEAFTCTSPDVKVKQ